MAGFVQFDPEKWEPSAQEGVAKVANAAKVEPSLATLAGLAAIPADVADGLDRLAHIAPPKGVNRDHWEQAVRDAHTLAGGGWAQQALALGWTPLDLFGAVTDKLGDPSGDGLAVKLAGRKLLAISEGFATIENGSSGRAYLHRYSNDGARLLWEIGRGR
jgi:hypothetical protein